MRIASLLAPLCVMAGLTLTAAAADTTVILSDVHLCCNKCVTGVATAIKPVATAKAVCDAPAGKVTITAPDKDTAQKAVDALVAAGYFGKSSDDTIKISAPTNAPEGKVKTLDVSGVHLCCGSCVTAVNDVLGKVPGVTANTAKTNAKTFTITGDFNAKDVFDGLQKAGLTGKADAPK